MTSELLELAARCEAAEGPDRELDEAIFVLVNPPPKGWRHSGWPDPHNPASVIYSVPAYTASLDAAMTLVLEGCWDHMEVYWPDHQMLGWTVHLLPNANLRRGEYSGFAQSHALALCAASLRARASQGSNDHGSMPEEGGEGD